LGEWITEVSQKRSEKAKENRLRNFIRGKELNTKKGETKIIIKGELVPDLMI